LKENQIFESGSKCCIHQVVGHEIKLDDRKEVQKEAQIDLANKEEALMKAKQENMLITKLVCDPKSIIH
jgi:hypothetical protein